MTKNDKPSHQRGITIQHFKQNNEPLKETKEESTLSRRRINFFLLYIKLIYAQFYNELYKNVVTKQLKAQVKGRLVKQLGTLLIPVANCWPRPLTTWPTANILVSM